MGSTGGLLILLTITVLLATQCSSRPCDDDCNSEYVSASKSSTSTKAASSATDQSCEQTTVNAQTGDCSQSSAKSSTQAASSCTDTSSESYVAYKRGAPPCTDSLPARASGECDEVYYKRVFPVDECDEASVKAFYVKVFRQYSGECDADYVTRIDAVFVVYKTLDCRTNVQYIQYLEKYYCIKYAKKEGETDEVYFKRTITKTTETEAEYTGRVTILKKCVTTVDWSRVTVAYSTTAGYTLTTSGSSTKSTSCGATITEEEVKKTYARIDKETDETYFKRIVTKTSTSITKEEYVQIITLIRKTYPTLSLWYDKKYIELVREYYTAVYSKGTAECEEDYVRRLTERESWECSDEVHVQRLCLVYQLTVTATVWSEEKYYEKYTKKVYSAVYKKAESEDETTYFKRVVLKSAQETDTVYVRRVTLVWRTYSSLSLWTCESTFSIVKQFYSLKYTQGSGECEETYVKRLTVKESWECSEELYVQRIHLVHLVTVSSTVWYEEKYYEQYTKTYYCVYYKKGEQESCSAWLTRVVTLLPGECEDNAIKRITLINKSKTGCGCWTSQNLSSLECANTLSKSYLLKLKKTFVKSGVLEKTTSAVKSVVSGCKDGLVTIVKRGCN